MRALRAKNVQKRMEKGMETRHRMIMVIISFGRRVGHRWTVGAWFFGPSSDRCKYRIDDT